MKIILQIEYALYIFSLCDIRLEHPFLTNHSLIWQAILLLLLLQEALSIAFTKGKIKFSKIMRNEILILLWLLLQFINTGTVMDEYATMVSFIITIFIFSSQFSKYNLMEQLLLIGFFVPNLLIVMNYITNQLNVFSILPSVSLASYFSSVYSQRIRFNLGFPNPNLLGNLVTCLLCISFPLFTVFKKKRKNWWILFGIIILDVIDLVSLIDCGTRTGLSCLIICILIIIFFGTTEKLDNHKHTIKIIRVMSLILIFIISIKFFFDNFLSLYIEGRQGSFDLLKLLSGWKWVFGIGIFSPGSVISNYLSHLDNYYIYLLLTTGIIGFILYTLLFLQIFNTIKRNNNNFFTYSLIGCFIADLLYGFGETCVIYPMFPSAAIFMVLFIAFVKMVSNNNIYEMQKES